MSDSLTRCTLYVYRLHVYVAFTLLHFILRLRFAVLRYVYGLRFTVYGLRLRLYGENTYYCYWSSRAGLASRK